MYTFLFPPKVDEKPRRTSPSSRLSFGELGRTSSSSSSSNMMKNVLPIEEMSISQIANLMGSISPEIQNTFQVEKISGAMFMEIQDEELMELIPK